LICLGGASVSAETYSPYITAQSKNLPFPKEFELKVEFWKAIYTRYTTQQGVIHDSEDLSIVYDAIQLPGRDDMKAVNRVRNEIREALFSVLNKRGDNLTSFERSVLSKFPRGVSRARLLRAAENIRFQRGQSNRFREGIIRSGYYIKHIEKILKEEGVPDFVKYLPHVESSFQEFAISKFGAAGLWQLMPATGRMFLRVEYVIDERLDPWVATRAAARHLKRDYQSLKAWPLALTAYNHGPGGVSRAVRTLGTTDIAEIAYRYESPSFGFASRNFYGQFLAAVEVASNYTRYFGDLPVKPTIEFDTPKIDKPIYLNEFSKAYDFSMDEFKRLNPGLRPPILQNKRPIPVGVVVRVPKGSKRQRLVASRDPSIGAVETPAKRSIQAEVKVVTKEEERKLATRSPQVKSRYAVRDLVEQKGWIQIEMNETIAQIAEWLSVTVDKIREWNGMEKMAQVQHGQKLLLKFSATTAAQFVEEREDYHKRLREDFFARYEVSSTETHEVRLGENLWSLCYQRYDIPPWLLEDYNPKVNLSELKPGTKLKIPVPIEKNFESVASGTELGTLDE
jgi:LysM repeat protein